MSPPGASVGAPSRVLRAWRAGVRSSQAYRSSRGAARPRTAFVLSGGASLGALQVGMLQALYERDVVPDVFVGTSAGALNAAFVAPRAAVGAAGGLLRWAAPWWRRWAFVGAAGRVPRVLLVVLIALFLAVGLDPAVRYLQHLRVRCGWDGCKAGPRQGLTLLGPV